MVEKLRNGKRVKKGIEAKKGVEKGEIRKDPLGQEEWGDKKLNKEDTIKLLESNSSEERMKGVTAISKNVEALTITDINTEYDDVKNAIVKILSDIVNKLKNVVELSILGANALKIVISYSEDKDARMTAIGGIKDEKDLVIIAMYSEYPDARLAAVGEIKDDKELARVANNCNYKDTGLAAVDKIEDRKVLSEIANHKFENGDVEEAVTDKLKRTEPTELEKELEKVLF